MEEMKPKTLGQMAYEAYNDSKGGKTWDGRPIAPWSELTDDVGTAVRVAWEEAAEVVRAQVLLRAPASKLMELALAKLPRDNRKLALAATNLEQAILWLESATRQGPVFGVPNVEIGDAGRS